MELLIQALLMLENSNVKKQTLLSLQLLINCAPVCLRGFFCNHDRRLNQNDDRFIVPICIAYWKRENTLMCMPAIFSIVKERIQ